MALKSKKSSISPFVSFVLKLLPGLIQQIDPRWISAAVHETIRLTCSPIVPHVATQNSTIGGKNLNGLM
jgi:hypothetical protein